MWSARFVLRRIASVFGTVFVEMSLGLGSVLLSKVMMLDKPKPSSVVG